MRLKQEILTVVDAVSVEYGAACTHLAAKKVKVQRNKKFVFDGWVHTLMLSDAKNTVLYCWISKDDRKEQCYTTVKQVGNIQSANAAVQVAFARK